jgi:endoglucanase
MRTIHGAVLLGVGFLLCGCGSSGASGAKGGSDAGAAEDSSAIQDAEATDGSPAEAGAHDAGAPHDGAAGSPDSGAHDSGTDGGATGLHVVGNTLVDSGKTVRLLGVDRSGTEYACIQGNGFFDGEVDQAAVTAMLSWHINAVRVPLNEDCWLAINGAPAQYSGTAYQTAITGWVNLLRQNGLYVIVDLHWNGGGTVEATGQQEMADSDHAPAFWTGVAGAFKADQGVIFDLYNEPYGITWACWLNGGCQADGWNVAGMQQLVDAVRATGATNVMMAGGLAYSSDLTEWLANKPSDPLGNLVASVHTYNFSGCNASSCWTSSLQSVAAQVPLVTGELGENDCAHGYIDSYMAWADMQGVSYLGWAWNADFACTSGPGLITDYTGTPTAFGVGLQAHLAIVGP